MKLTQKEIDEYVKTISEFWTKAHAGIIYLYDDYYENAFKVDAANNKAYAKYSGKEPFEVDPSSEKMENSMGADNLVDKDFYDNF